MFWIPIFSMSRVLRLPGLWEAQRCTSRWRATPHFGVAALKRQRRMDFCQGTHRIQSSSTCKFTQALGNHLHPFICFIKYFLYLLFKDASVTCWIVNVNRTLKKNGSTGDPRGRDQVASFPKTFSVIKIEVLPSPFPLYFKFRTRRLGWILLNPIIWKLIKRADWISRQLDAVQQRHW